MDVGKTPSQELEPIVSSPDIKRKTENNDTNEDDKTHIVHFDNDSSGSMDPHQKLKKKKKNKKSGKEESKEKIEDQTPQNGSQDDSHVALEGNQTEKVTATPEANHKDSKEAEDEEYFEESLSNSSLGMRMKDETELEKKKWEEKRVKAIKEEDVIETDSDHSKDERPIIASDEKKQDSDDDKVLRKSNSELNENSSPPTPLMVEILSMSHHSDSSDEESEAESSTTPGSTPKSEKKKRPTLLSEPEFNENFILDTLLTIRTSTLGAMKRPWEEISEKDFHSSIHYKISRTGSQKRFIVKDFAPKVFRNLRHQFFVSTEDYLQSWSKTNIKQEKSAGKSSSVFIFLKTIVLY